MRVENYWAVYETTDERGSLGQLVGHWVHQINAEAAAKGVGWYGGRGAVLKESFMITDNGNIYALKKELPVTIYLNVNLIAQKKTKRELALAKLTPEDIKILGL